jgi:hypothetical protein
LLEPIVDLADLAVLQAPDRGALLALLVQERSPKSRPVTSRLPVWTRTRVAPAVPGTGSRSWISPSTARPSVSSRRSSGLGQK